MNRKEIMIIFQEDLEALADQLAERIVSKIPPPEILPPPKERPKYYTRKETAAKLKCSYPKLWALTKEGHIEAYKLGRKVLYRSEDVEGMIQKLNFKQNSL